MWSTKIQGAGAQDRPDPWIGSQWQGGNLPVLGGGEIGRSRYGTGRVQDPWWNSWASVLMIEVTSISLDGEVHWAWLIPLTFSEEA